MMVLTFICSDHVISLDGCDGLGKVAKMQVDSIAS
jgi:hypothetical protein